MTAASRAVGGPIDVQPHVLREYALLADGERGALIGPRGEIVWMCAPRWDSDAVFSSLLGGPGVYTVSPVDPWFVWGGYYEEGTLVWRSRWMTSSGLIECRETLARPGDRHRLVLLRQVAAVDGDAEVQVDLDVRPGFGQHQLRDLQHDGAMWTARAGPLHVRWTGVEAADVADGRLGSRLCVPAGGNHDLVLEICDHPLDAAPPDPQAEWSATANCWHEDVPELDGILGKRDARHAYAVLTGLTSSSGGMVAAATTALPERSEAGRDYDYRFSWIRDQCYAGQAIAADRPHRLMDDAVDFVSARVLTDGARLRPAYSVDGDTVPDERAVSNLTGYPGGGNKIGNGIDRQFQLDSFGEALLLLASAARHDHLDTEHWRAVETTVEAVRQRWGEPGAGVWETQQERWAHSRLTCAAGLRAVARAAPATQAADWASLADAIVADTTRDCLHPGGRWQRSPTDPGVDGALLLPAVRGALRADDPRSIATLQAVRDELTEDGYVYRFRHDHRPLHEAEGAFLLCSYFMALACHQQGETREARAWYERGRAACGPARLYSEEYDVVQHQLRGNLPQAFVHALLLESSCRLVRPWEAP